MNGNAVVGGAPEEVRSASYDPVAGHCAYSRLTNTYSYGKPVIGGEVGFCHPQRFDKTYKGYPFTGKTDATNAIVTARVPAQMDYVSGSGEPSGGVYDFQAKSVTWTIPRVPPTGAGTRTFQAKVR